ncbi:substrate-binding domain-containing protein [Paraburkholderia youngii]|uniref:substrate-binding domain-containing protein n=1 Tax=Paraburkholderia youngii TaxID=2782701 RepID=UPI003D1DB57B
MASAKPFSDGSNNTRFLPAALACALAGAGPRAAAAICGNDQIAMGVLRGAEELGIAIPEQLPDTGFDGLAIAREARPPLTTVHVDTREIGTLARSICSMRWMGERRNMRSSKELNSNDDLA